MTFPSYKSTNTLKLLMGITPSGWSNLLRVFLYSGSSSDKELISQSGLLPLPGTARVPHASYTWLQIIQLHSLAFLFNDNFSHCTNAKAYTLQHMGSAVLPRLFLPGLFPLKTHGFRWVYHVSAVPLAACTRMYTAQATIWLTNTTATETVRHLICINIFLKQHHHQLGCLAATHFASHVPVQHLDLLLMH